MIWCSGSRHSFNPLPPVEDVDIWSCPCGKYVRLRPKHRKFKTINLLRVREALAKVQKEAPGYYTETRLIQVVTQSARMDRRIARRLLAWFARNEEGRKDPIMVIAQKLGMGGLETIYKILPVGPFMSA